MLRVGLTGSLGSGKSSAAVMFAAHGAHILQADEIARELMEPGQPVFQAILRHFGRQVLTSDGTLDRRALARLAFAEGRAEELNSIVHPATIARQAELADAIFAESSDAIVMVESALIFETRFAGANGWRSRFDRIILVTAPDELKIARFVARSGPGDADLLAAEARRRLAAQMPDEGKMGSCDFVAKNDGDLVHLRRQVDAVWAQLAVPQGTSPSPPISTKSSIY